jgi:hypothetical protein
MKQFILLLFIVVLTSACTTSNSTEGKSTVNKATAPVMTFAKESHDFGQVNEGDKVVYDFFFTNTGKSALIISSAAATCGCTVPEYPKEPVKPGDTASIHVTFSSAGKEGEQNKNVTLVCNTATRSEMLYMKGFVKTEEKK